MRPGGTTRPMPGENRMRDVERAETPDGSRHGHQDRCPPGKNKMACPSRTRRQKSRPDVMADDALSGRGTTFSRPNQTPWRPLATDSVGMPGLASPLLNRGILSEEAMTAMSLLGRGLHPLAGHEIVPEFDHLPLGGHENNELSLAV